MEDLLVHWRITLISKKLSGGCKLDSSGSGYGPVVGSCERVTVPSGFIQCEKFCPVERLLASQECLCLEELVRSILFSYIVVNACFFKSYFILGSAEHV